MHNYRENIERNISNLISDNDKILKTGVIVIGSITTIYVIGIGCKILAGAIRNMQDLKKALNGK